MHTGPGLAFRGAISRGYGVIAGLRGHTRATGSGLAITHRLAPPACGSQTGRNDHVGVLLHIDQHRATAQVRSLIHNFLTKGEGVNPWVLRGQGWAATHSTARAL